MTAKGWGRFATLYLLGVVANMCASFQAPLVLPLGRAFHVEASVVGLVMSAQFIAYLFGGSAVGGLVARIGVRRAARLGLALIAATAMVNWSARTLPLFVAGNLVQGLGMLTAVVAGQIGAAAIATDESRARLIAIWATAPLLGLAGGLLLSSRFADGEVWRHAFVALAAIAVVLLAPTARLPTALPTPGPGKPKGGGLMGELGALRITLAVAFSVAAINGSVSCWPTYLSRVHDTTPGRIGALSSMTMLAGVAGSLLVGAALGRRSSIARMTGLILPTALASAVVVFGAFTGLAATIAAMIFWQLAAGALTGLLFAILPGALRNPANLPAATGMLYQGAAGGTMMGAPLYLWLAVTSHASTALTLLTGGVLVGVALAIPMAAGSPRGAARPQ